jgi:hypothetical protein
MRPAASGTAPDRDSTAPTAASTDPALLVLTALLVPAQWGRAQVRHREGADGPAGGLANTDPESTGQGSTGRTDLGLARTTRVRTAQGNGDPAADLADLNGKGSGRVRGSGGRTAVPGDSATRLAQAPSGLTYAPPARGRTPAALSSPSGIARCLSPLRTHGARSRRSRRITSPPSRAICACCGQPQTWTTRTWRRSRTTRCGRLPPPRAGSGCRRSPC